MQLTATKHGVSLAGQSARQFTPEDLTIYDYIFVMDRDNLHDVLHLDRDESQGYKVRLFREFDPEPEDFQVPDPYYGGDQGFERVFLIVERTVDVILERLVGEHAIQ